MAVPVRPDRPLKKQLSLIREGTEEAEEADLFPSLDIIKEKGPVTPTKSRGGSIRFSEVGISTPLIIKIYITIRFDLNVCCLRVTIEALQSCSYLFQVSGLIK